MKKIIFIISFYVFSSALFAQVININHALVEKDIHDISHSLTKIYEPIIREHYKKNLVFEINWQDETVNSYSLRENDDWKVYVAGGIARARGMNKDTFALIMCHELGHHLGGAPLSFLYGGWPSAEGQADYWATSKCLKKYFAEYPHEEITINSNIPEKVLRDCSSIYATFLEQKICARIAIASINFSYFMSQLPNARPMGNIETPDPKIVKGTNTNDYPRAQCRLDTLYQGALCSINPNELTSDKDPAIASCNDYAKPGARPLCWYKP